MEAGFECKGGNRSGQFFRPAWFRGRTPSLGGQGRKLLGEHGLRPQGPNYHWPRGQGFVALQPVACRQYRTRRDDRGHPQGMQGIALRARSALCQRQQFESPVQVARLGWRRSIRGEENPLPIRGRGGARAQRFGPRAGWNDLRYPRGFRSHSRAHSQSDFAPPAQALALQTERGSRLANGQGRQADRNLLRWVAQPLRHCL